MQTTAACTPASRTLGGKYLTVMLNDEEYGLEILRVREIIKVIDITHVPQMPAYVEGVVNLRGKVIPVIDLRTKLGLERTTYTDETCIIVVDGEVQSGIIVDKVREVYDIPTQDIEPLPTLNAGIDTEFVLGMGKIKDQVKILLNIDKVLGVEALAALETA